MEHEHGVTFEPMSIARCHELLGADADNLSDAEVEQVRRSAETIAHVIVEIFLEQHPQD